MRVWFESDPTLFEACTDNPEEVWAAILEILKRELTEVQMAELAAGPLETILAYHGPVFIDRVEVEARRSERFNRLLGGVWRNSIKKGVWHRIEAVRKAIW